MTLLSLCLCAFILVPVGHVDALQHTLPAEFENIFNERPHHARAGRSKHKKPHHTGAGFSKQVKRKMRMKQEKLDKTSRTAGEVYTDAEWLPQTEPGPECNSDSNCPYADGDNWRCKVVTGLKLTKKNSCRLPGLSNRDNSTCMCVPMTCGETRPKPINKTAKQYLMIGDCVTNMAVERIQDVLDYRGWETEHIPGNAANVNKGAHCINDWLRSSVSPLSRNRPMRKWDVISFSFGLHDIARHTEFLSVHDYKILFISFLRRLHAEQVAYPELRLLWVTMPPVPAVPAVGDADCGRNKTNCLSPPRYHYEAIAYNKAGLDALNHVIARGARIETLDLHSKVLELCQATKRGYYTYCPKYQNPHDIHFTSVGYDHISQLYLTALLKDEQIDMADIAADDIDIDIDSVEEEAEEE